MQVSANQRGSNESGTARRGVLDISLLIGSAVLVIGLGIGAFDLSDKYHIGDAWIFALCAGVGLIAVVGKSLRSKFRKPLFVVFFIGWLAAHILVMLLVLKYLTLLFVYPFTFLDLLLGYSAAFWLFGLPSNDQK